MCTLFGQNLTASTALVKKFIFVQRLDDRIIKMQHHFSVWLLLFALTAAEEGLEDLDLEGDYSPSCEGVVPEDILDAPDVMEAFNKWCLGKEFPDDPCKLCIAPERKGREEEILICPDSPCIPVKVAS
ncbi:hypothetical protein AB6A40_008613 [Gnathostoma spinigerum]|uniref:Uncharacterized protein n=1 Tax=Gnathostoma spinigerum TaxID=75299 RepID=A0ABD6EXC4_9BILA